MSKGDHDQNDRNCIMYYNDSEKGNGGAAFGWGVKAVPEKYTMRLAVEYDAAQKEFGSLTGAWVAGSRKLVKNPPNLDVEYRVFEFTGSLVEIRKAFAETVFTPFKWVDPNKNIRLVLEEPVMSPAVSVKYPYTIIVPGNAGKIRPLADVKLEAMNLQAPEPRFCGKCVLKLRGWRVGLPAAADGTPSAPAILPEKSKAMPINGRMTFDGYQITEDAITFKENGVDRTIAFGLKAKDPGTGHVMGPFRFMHRHTFRWESSTGKMADLDGLTREIVLYDKPTQTGAFNAYADPDQKFAQSAGPGKDGSGFDFHSIRNPSLICARFAGQPIVGIIRAKQSYQFCTVPGKYSKTASDWVDIPQSHFILEKEVYQNGKEWIIAFRKMNDPEKNPIPFRFEVHYRIGSELSFKPDLIANPYSGCSEAVPQYSAPSGSVEQEFWASGQQFFDIPDLKSKKNRAVTLAELIKSGFAIRGSEPKK